VKIIRSYRWNNQDYTVVEDDKGNRTELRCSEKEAPKAFARIEAAEAAIEPTPEVKPIADYTDKELLAEVTVRDLTLLVRGEVR